MFPRFLLSSRVELELRHANLVECPLGPDTLWGFLCLFAQGNLSSDQLIFFVLESESEQKNSVFKQKLFPVFVLFLSLFPIELQLIRWLFFNWFSLCFLSFFQVRNLEKNRFLIEPLFLVLFELNSLIKFSSDWAQILEKLSKKKTFHLKIKTRSILFRRLFQASWSVFCWKKLLEFDREINNQIRWCSKNFQFSVWFSLENWKSFKLSSFSVLFPAFSKPKSLCSFWNFVNKPNKNRRKNRNTRNRIEVTKGNDNGSSIGNDLSIIFDPKSASIWGSKHQFPVHFQNISFRSINRMPAKQVRKQTWTFGESFSSSLV